VTNEAALHRPILQVKDAQEKSSFVKQHLFTAINIHYLQLHRVRLRIMPAPHE
jgi:hypothetical protein